MPTQPLPDKKQGDPVSSAGDPRSGIKSGKSGGKGA